MKKHNVGQSVPINMGMTSKKLLICLPVLLALFASTPVFCQHDPAGHSVERLFEPGLPAQPDFRMTEISPADQRLTLAFHEENSSKTLPVFNRVVFLGADYSLGLEDGNSVNDRVSSPSRHRKAGLFAHKRKKIAEADSFRLRNQDASIWKKMGRAEMFIGGAEIIGMGILILLPKGVTKWEDDWMADARRNLVRAWTSPPTVDEDDFGFNYIGHPVAGSYYYNSIRSQKATWFQSFTWSFLQSAIWEYLIEGIAEQPSVQDLIVTPVGGAILGEASHLATIKMRKGGFNFLEKVTTMIINPFYVVNNGYRTKNKKVQTK
jgi:hypothetical protein